VKLENAPQIRDVVIVGGGISGLSAGIYLGRAQRDTLIIDSGKSMARWEPEVQNYFGFPEGIAGEELLRRGAEQVRRYNVPVVEDEISEARKEKDLFCLKGANREYWATRVLLATGIYHLPPQIEGVGECLGHSMFFCKDCDGVRVQGKSILIYGWNNEAVEYALAMLLYSPIVGIVLDGRKPAWDKQHQDWLKEHEIPVYPPRVTGVIRETCQIKGLALEDTVEVAVDALFTTRGDVALNKLAKGLGAKLDEEGQISVDACLHTSVKGLYASGCVTPANCQMIIAAGEGAKAAQSINRDLFEESLELHRLRRFRNKQLLTTETEPAIEALH
jgi:thioredoxin reductase (NADPH)